MKWQYPHLLDPKFSSAAGESGQFGNVQRDMWMTRGAHWGWGGRCGGYSRYGHREAGKFGEEAAESVQRTASKVAEKVEEKL